MRQKEPKRRSLRRAAAETAMMIRLCKASLVAAMALLLALVAFNNIVDYGDNWTFVQHVMAMDSIFPGYKPAPEHYAW